MTTAPSNDYETITGTTPDPDEHHEPRTLTHTRTDETGTQVLTMMSEIGDGTFVQWTRCNQCSKKVDSCRCPSGPQEPDHIVLWRTRRFIDSFAARGAEPALPVNLQQRDRRVAGVMRHLIDQGFTITPPAREEPPYDPSLEDVEEPPYDTASETDTRPESDTAVHVARGLDDAIEAASASKEQDA